MITQGVVHRILVYPLHRDADASERRRVRGREGDPVVQVDDVAEHAVCAAEVILTAMLSGQQGAVRIGERDHGEGLMMTSSQWSTSDSSVT